MVGAGRGGAAIECPALSERGPAAVEDSSDLLKRRMRALHLDPDDLDRAPARFTGIKTGLCSRCEARGSACAISMRSSAISAGATGAITARTRPR